MTTPERWADVQRVLETVLELPLEARPAYLTSACEEDAALRGEVERLVRACSDAEASVGFLGEPGAEFASPIIAQVAAWESGDATRATARIEALRDALAGRYTIERELGHGGMATVFLARDLRHDRSVALKVMKPGLLAAASAERFLREIRIAARLTHPHILPLHDSGEAAELLYYVMPYVAGESLRNRLTREGPVPVSEAVRILREVASALDYAHRQGVVHRDIKPENILLQDGHAVVADFGIARAVSRALETGETAGGAPETVTQTGVALGTPAYMSPEQAAGNPHSDHRADLYALGVVAYEMLDGAHPFVRHTPEALLAAHLTETPEPLAQRRPEVPAEVSELVLRLLAKRPEDRPESSELVLAELERVATGPVASGETVAVAGTRSAKLAAAVSVLMIVAAATVIIARYVAGPPVAIAAQRRQLTFDGEVQLSAISPDGSLLAYVATGLDTDRLLVRDLAGGSTIKLAALGPGGLDYLKWSPNGSSLLFAGEDSTGQIVGLIYPRLGGAPSLSPCGRNRAVWSPDGTGLTCWGTVQRSRVTFVNLATLDTSSIPPPDSVGAHGSGQWSPTGEFFALANHVFGPPERDEIWTVRRGASTWRRLVPDLVGLGDLVWSPTGDAVYYLIGDKLGKIGVRSDGTARGAPEVLQTGLRGWSFSLTADGSALAYTSVQRHSNIWSTSEIGPAGSGRLTWSPLTRGTALKTVPAISPDGAWVAYREGETGNIIVVPFGGGAPRQVTMSRPDISGPAWSPDGSRLAFWRMVQGVRRLRVVAREGGSERTYEKTLVGDYPPTWAPGARILFLRPGNQNYHFLDPQTGAEEPIVTNDSVGWMLGALASPDGRSVAAFWNREPKSGLWLISMEDSSQKLIWPGEFAVPIGWSADGRSIYVAADTQVRVVSVNGRTPARAISLPYVARFCSALERPSGLKLACTVVESVSDVWMLQNFDPNAAPRAR